MHRRETTRSKGVIVDKGPWEVEGTNVASGDFEHDVVLRISGDFDDDDVAIRYAEWLAHELNSTAALRAQLQQAQAGAPGTPLGRWNAISEWALSQPWCNPHSSAGWESQMKATIARQREWIEKRGHHPECQARECAVCGYTQGPHEWGVMRMRHEFQLGPCTCGYAELVVSGPDEPPREVHRDAGA